MPKESTYYFYDDDDDDEELDLYERSSRNRAPFWDGTEWSDEDIGECPGLDD